MSAVSAPRPFRLYRAEVFHARLKPHPHRMRRRATLVALDLDRLDEVSGISRFFSVGSFNALSFEASDHGKRSSVDLRAQIDAALAAAGAARPARVELLCFPRIFGASFNPLAVYYGYDAQGRLSSLVYEVTNTFHERHHYVVPLIASGTTAPAHERDKALYVSPFLDMDLRYRFRTDAPSDRLNLRIFTSDREGVVLTALLTGVEVPPTAKQLLAAAFASPAFGFRTLAAIHVEAVKLWLKGHKIRPHTASVAVHSPGIRRSGS